MVFRSLAEQWECRVEEGHLMSDHVHMLLSVPPKYSVSNVMGFIKGEERDSYCAGICGTTQEFCRPAFLGAGLLGINGRQKRGCRASGYPKPGKRKTNASNNWNWWRFERRLFLTALSGSRYLKPPALPEAADLVSRFWWESGFLHP